MNISEIEKKLKGISAQGYTTDRNKHKVLDSDLLFDIEEAMFKAFRSEISALLDSLKGEEREEHWENGSLGNLEVRARNQATQEFNNRINKTKE